MLFVGKVLCVCKFPLVAESAPRLFAGDGSSTVWILSSHKSLAKQKAQKNTPYHKMLQKFKVVHIVKLFLLKTAPPRQTHQKLLFVDDVNFQLHWNA